MQNNSEIIIYQTDDHQTKVQVRLEDETVWLTQKQMAELFDKGRSTITEHIKNIFDEGELDQKLVCREFRHTGTDNKTYMAEWIAKLDEFLKLSEKKLLTDAGKITAEQAHKKAELEFEKYRNEQDNKYISDFDREMQKYRKIK